MKLENAVRVDEVVGLPLGNYSGTWIGDTVTFETDNGTYQGKVKSPCDCVVVVSANGIGVIASSAIYPVPSVDQKLLYRVKSANEKLNDLLNKK